MSKIRAALKRLAGGGSPVFPGDLEDNPHGWGASVPFDPTNTTELRGTGPGESREGAELDPVVERAPMLPVGYRASGAMTPDWPQTAYDTVDAAKDLGYAARKAVTHPFDEVMFDSEKLPTNQKAALLAGAASAGAGGFGGLASESLSGRALEDVAASNGLRSSPVEAGSEPPAARVYRGANAPEQWPPTNPRHDTFWASDNPAVANGWTMGGKGPAENPHIIPADVQFRNPLVVDAKGEPWGDIPYNGTTMTSDKLAAIARAAGHDGLQISNVREGGGAPLGTTYAALQPGTVRSTAGSLLFSNPKEAAPLGLAMDQASRMQRAREMGFDTDKTWYHGTASDFDAFTPSEKGLSGPGVYLTDDPGRATKYAFAATEDGSGSRILPVHVRGRIASYNMPADEAKAQGFTGRGSLGPEAVIFDPADIRSVNANFDPAKVGQNGLLFSNPKEAAPVGAAVAGAVDTKYPTASPDFAQTSELGRALQAHKDASDEIVRASEARDAYMRQRGEMPYHKQNEDPEAKAIEDAFLAAHAKRADSIPQIERLIQSDPRITPPELEEPTGFKQRVYRGASSGQRWSPDNEDPAPRTGKFWASDNPQVTDEYSRIRSHTFYPGENFGEGRSNPAVLPADVDFKKPLIIDAEGKDWANVPFSDIKNPSNWGRSKWSTDELAEWAAGKGHDGLVVKNVRDDGPQATTVVALKRGTVKSPLTGETIYANSDASAGLADMASGEGQIARPNINTKPFPKPGNLEELVDSFKNREDAPGLLDYDSYMNSEPTTVGINHDFPAPNDFPAREKLNQPLKNLRHPATRDRLARQATPNLFESPQGTLVNPWYDPAPLLDMWKRYWGDQHGETELGRYLDNVAATSPLTEVGHNLREASVPYSLHHQGSNLNDTALMDISGLAARNKRNMIRTVAAGEPLNPSSAPKVANFQANLRGAGVKEPSYDAQGNRITTPITLDTVMAKTWPYRTKEGDQALFKKSAYGAGVDAGHHLAEGMGGVPGADWQAAVWQGQQKGQHADTSYGARYNDSFARQLETAVHQKAAREGIDPQRMWEEFILGRKPLFADGGDVGDPEPSDFQKVLASNPYGWGPEPEVRGTGPGESRDPYAPMSGTFEDSQAQALSPTMGAYGAGQTGREVYDKLHEGDWKGSIEAAAPLIAMAMFPGPKGARFEREAGTLPEAPGGAKGYGTETAGVRDPGGVQRGEGALAPRDRASDPYAPLLGIPHSARIPGHQDPVETTPIPWLVDTVNDYMRKRGTAHELPEAFGPFDTEQAKRIAQAYEDMEHNPGDPKVRQAYEAMREETIGQYRALKDAGANFRYYTDYKDNPYAESPAMGYPELRDKRSLAIFPTEAGYGNAFTPSELENNPLLKSTTESLGDRKDVPLNDLFRAVHDAYGHYAYGNAYFRHQGEDRAYLIHSGMYSPEARAGIAPELRGQNSWVNWGPHGEANRTASEADTIFAPQKIGALPEWAVEGGRQGISAEEYAKLKGKHAGGGAVTRAMNVLKRAFGGHVADDDE